MCRKAHKSSFYIPVDRPLLKRRLCCACKCFDCSGILVEKFFFKPYFKKNTSFIRWLILFIYLCIFIRRMYMSSMRRESVRDRVVFLLQPCRTYSFPPSTNSDFNLCAKYGTDQWEFSNEESHLNSRPSQSLPGLPHLSGQVDRPSVD